MKIEESRTTKREHAVTGASTKRIFDAPGRAAFARGYCAGFSPGLWHFEARARNARRAHGRRDCRVRVALLAGGKPGPGHVGVCPAGCLALYRRGEPGENIYDEIALAATTLSSTKTGALIVIERNVGLKSIINGGVKLDAQLSYDLIVAIFNPASPLHDGAVVVRDQRIAAASCFLPLSLNPRLSKDLGTRHRAALGVTEDSDAVVIVVSEETGLISFVRRGQIKRALDATKLRAAIFQAIEGRSADRGGGSGAQRRSDETETEEIASA